MAVSTKVAREWVVSSYQGFKGFQLQNCTLQDPIGSEIRRKIEAFALNWADDCLMHDRYCTLPYFYGRQIASADTRTMDQAFVPNAPDGLSPVETTSVWRQVITAYFQNVELTKAAGRRNVLAPFGAFNALADGTLKPNVDRVFPMGAYMDAWRYLKGAFGSHGKVIVETGA